MLNLDYTLVIKESSAVSQLVDPNARRTSPDCGKRMGSMIHDAYNFVLLVEEFTAILAIVVMCVLADQRS